MKRDNEDSDRDIVLTLEPTVMTLTLTLIPTPSNYYYLGAQWWLTIAVLGPQVIQHCLPARRNTNSSLTCAHLSFLRLGPQNRTRVVAPEATL